MMGPRPWDVSSRFALTTVILSTGLAAASGWIAWDLAPLPEMPVQANEFRVPEAPSADSGVSAYAVLTATEGNPFRPDRRPPRDPYVPPALRRAAPPPPRPRPRPARVVPAFQLDGIAWTPGRPGVAILGVAGRPARLFREGEEIQAFRVQTISEQSVTLVGPDTTVTLSLDSGTSSRTNPRTRENPR